MAAVRVGSTDPRLLRRVAVLWDDPAWRELFDRYAPFIRARCSARGLDADSVNELCQRVWIELARRMPSYQYDPGGSFRGWLSRLCHHRAIDLMRERRSRAFEPMTGEEPVDGHGPAGRDDGNAEDGEPEPGRLRLLMAATAAQEEVEGKVKPVRWEAFWRVVIEGQPIVEVAADLGLKYATVYAGVNHVAELLRAEGRREVRLGPDVSPPHAKG